jgi:hypothetical protein
VLKEAPSVARLFHLHDGRAECVENGRKRGYPHSANVCGRSIAWQDVNMITSFAGSCHRKGNAHSVPGGLPDRSEVCSHLTSAERSRRAYVRQQECC